jgi:hypothetical protein
MSCMPCKPCLPHAWPSIRGSASRPGVPLAVRAAAVSPQLFGDHGCAGTPPYQPQVGCTSAACSQHGRVGCTERHAACSTGPRSDAPEDLQERISPCMVCWENCQACSPCSPFSSCSAPSSSPANARALPRKSNAPGILSSCRATLPSPTLPSRALRGHRACALRWCRSGRQNDEKNRAGCSVERGEMREDSEEGKGEWDRRCAEEGWRREGSQT